MNITIHRGNHQIGGSFIELATENTRIIMDVGQELPTLDGNSAGVSPPPPIAGLFSVAQEKVDAVLISHYHGDHIGHIGEIQSDIPVFIGEKAARIFNTTSKFTGRSALVNPTGYLTDGQEIIIGDFSITPYLVDHSAFDAYAFVVKTRDKCVVYTGDFRAHGAKAALMQSFVQKLPDRVDAIIVEGTTMGRPGDETKTEKQIGQEAAAFMNTAGKPVFVLQSAANIDRLVQMYKAARQSQRLFVMDIYAAHIVSQLGDRIPNPRTFKQIRVFYPFHLTKRMFSQPGGDELMWEFSRYRISAEELQSRTDYCMLVRDSMLYDLKKRLGNIDGAGLIYSMWTGYLKTNRMRRFMSFCRSANMEIIYKHTSGHADVKTISNIVNSCNPTRLIPVHTEHPEKFAELFHNTITLDDGQKLSI